MKRSLSAAAKLRAVELAMKTSKKNAAKEFKVDRKQIQRWCQDVDKLRRCNPNAKRLPGAGRPVISDKMEQLLLEWITDQRNKSVRVSRKLIQRKAKALFLELEGDSVDFHASEGWLSRFLRRNHYSLRKRTTVSQKTPDDLRQRVMDYVLYVDALKSNCAYRPSNIGAADETAVFIDPIQDTTIEKTGSKTISIFATGYQKAKFTVMLSATADGTKLKPFICMKGRRTPKDLLDFKTAIICMTENGWMNESTTKEWITKVWGTLSFGRRLLSWDSFNAHRTISVKQYLEKLRTDIAMIPGGCTSLLQAPDVCWIKNFKAAYVELYED